MDTAVAPPPRPPPPPPPPCGLTKQEVISLKDDVPLVGGLCQNPFRILTGELTACGCPVGEHPSELTAAYNVSSVRVLGDFSGPHSTAIIVGLKTVLACAHSLALEPAGERGLKYVEDYWIQERVTKSSKGECIEENRVPLKLYKFHAENDWALFQRSDDKCFEESEIAIIDKELETKPNLSYLRCNATVLHCPVALFASIQKEREFSIGCDQSDIRIQGQSTHHVKYEGRDLVRGSSGGGIFMGPYGNLLAMHVEAIVEADYEASEESGVMQIMPTDKKSASGEPDPYSHFQVHEAGSQVAKKAKCDSDTIASLAGGNNGRGSALIICKFPRLMYHINCLEESVTKMSGKSELTKSTLS